MRRLIAFTCEGALLGGSLDAASGTVGVLMATGGSQTRIGSHRLYERLAASCAKAGYPVLRFDRRGVGDSEGLDSGFAASEPDLAAAAAALRAECPQIDRLVGFGLCDGATAMALFGGQCGLDGLILANPWLVEADVNDPAPAAIKAHYAKRLTSLSGWRDIFSGKISYRKALRGFSKIATESNDALAGDVAAALAKQDIPLALILAHGDATAVAAQHCWQSPAYAALRERTMFNASIRTDSHSFARPGDQQALHMAVLDALEILGRNRL